MKSNGGKILLFVFIGLILIVFTFSAGLWTGSLITRGGMNPAINAAASGTSLPLSPERIHCHPDRSRNPILSPSGKPGRPFTQFRGSTSG